MTLIIDAVNIRTGGGLTHLIEILSANNFKRSGFDKIYLLTTVDIRKEINNTEIIISRISLGLVDKIFYVLFPLKIISRYIDTGDEDLIFSPAGTFFSKKVNFVSMSQNMLVFEKKERNRFPPSFRRLRYNILETLQKRSLMQAKGNIFISNYAFNYISKKYPKIEKHTHAVIYHGVSQRFRCYPKIQYDLSHYSTKDPFKILYVSIINYYKHQDKLIEAVKILRRKGVAVHLDLIGPMNPSIKYEFEKAIKGNEDFVTYHGQISYDEIHSFYKNTNLFVFTSTCENMPNILIEAMSAGLPILCSGYGPMPEILKDAGLYCEPTDPLDISGKLETMINSKELRKKLSIKAYESSINFNWSDCSHKTLSFLYEVSKKYKKAGNSE